MEGAERRLRRDRPRRDVARDVGLCGVQGAAGARPLVAGPHADRPRVRRGPRRASRSQIWSTACATASRGARPTRGGRSRSTRRLDSRSTGQVAPRAGARESRRERVAPRCGRRADRGSRRGAARAVGQRRRPGIPRGVPAAGLRPDRFSRASEATQARERLSAWPSSTRSPALTGGSPKRRTVARAPRSSSPCLRRASPTWGAPTARVQRV